MKIVGGLKVAVELGDRSALRLMRRAKTTTGQPDGGDGNEFCAAQWSLAFSDGPSTLSIS
jgi:hypothetical protein